MTPGARISAAIEILDQIATGSAAEQALTAWARGSRFAGSKDRAAVRDHVYDVLRCKASLSVMAGGTSGRDLMRALALRDGWEIANLFNGMGHAPDPISEAEADTLLPVPDVWDQCDIPQWLWPMWQSSLGADAAGAGHAQQVRAPLYLRINQRKATVAQAAEALAEQDITTVPHESVAGCLKVLQNERRVKLSEAYTDGWVEVQDAASQAAMGRLEIAPDSSVLDYCAGGGGKALAVAVQNSCNVVAHDISEARMADIAPRAERAGVVIGTSSTADLSSHGLFDVVLCDSPCSGSGTWRRTPDAKWRLDQDKLSKYTDLQHEVLAKSVALTKSGGTVVYMTCSVLDCENAAIIANALAENPNLVETDRMTLRPSEQTDGFFLCVLKNMA